MARSEGKFKIKKISKISELQEGTIIDIPESDLCLQSDTHIIQMEYIKPDEDTNKYEIKPGVFTLEETAAGVGLAKIELRERNLLTGVNNTAAVTREAELFFSKLHIYEKLERPKKRGVLIHSKPGMGKTSSIERFCGELIKQDTGTVVMIWPTSQVDADSVSSFLSTRSMFTPECTRMILIIEDIGGGEREEGGVSPVDSGLLNLLDGVGVTFKLATFIVATTNHPEKLLESLANRPERFDLVMALNPPNAEERVLLLEFISKRELSDDEKDAVANIKGTENFSIAHLGEVAVRALLHDKTYRQVIDELITHSKNYKKGFEEKRGLGMGFGND